ncbi:radial spoke head protein 3 homolog B-like isoform X2 [Paramacrobiotus metropolitanus]|nr:radial spoke head protein 3 homolog B-like isoform X2 [Paramacrobiotus metropolitanus]XP_055345607.1 radial spoke head protein 3 homolog B-like isoform X2 [Paramacrobiotus metropolitanus]XP_055345608.1 radial spoke head protein 3 homolog B-like isoform X2 [Paramacrobiotus metropolitanus]
MADPRVWRGITTDLYKKGALIEDTSRAEMALSKNPQTTSSLRLGRKFTGRTTDRKGHLNVQLKKWGKVKAVGVGAGDNGPNVLLEPLDRPLDDDILHEEERRRICPLTPELTQATSSAEVSTDIPLGELFRFDVEVKPLLEILIGQALEESLLEVYQEENVLFAKEEDYDRQEQRNWRRVERQRLQGQAQRADVEKKTRLLETAIISEEEAEQVEQESLRAFARMFLEALVPNVFVRLRQRGFFTHPMRKEMDSDFLPWLTESISRRLDEYYAVNLVVEGLMRAVLIENRLEYRRNMTSAAKTIRGRDLTSRKK